MLKKIALASLLVVCASFGIAGTVAAKSSATNVGQARGRPAGTPGHLPAGMRC